MTTSATEKYDQAESFHEFASTSSKRGLKEQLTRAKNIIKAAEANKAVPKGQKEIIAVVYKGLDKADSTDGLVLSFYEADEMRLLEDGKIIDYLYHRYRYVVYPKSKVLDDYPPLLQIEPTSICNFRCVFCFQTDESYTK